MSPHTPQQDDGFEAELRDIAAQNPPIPRDLHAGIMARLKAAPAPRAARWPWLAVAASVAIAVAVWNSPVIKPSPKIATPSIALTAPKLALPTLPHLRESAVGNQFAQAVTSPLRASGSSITFSLRAPQMPERLTP